MNNRPEEQNEKARQPDRKDFGITYNPVLDNGGAIVSDEIRINLQIELTQAGASAAN